MDQATKFAALLKRARDYKMSPAERRAQRASLVMGLRGANSTLTEKKVHDVLEDLEGAA
ncbi:hypothetical protein [Rhizorhabdus sp.]|uniref:hypothetical protein n=1 Tax=Rhizorhabdus sp. TaxID=1968843 RepID=UPI0035ADC76B